ncbi:MAG: hypothetical protein Q8N23_12140 [Archangium sp.]|nr:hypothetical protein [Archangium sp.]MDP3153418.1 hypothetical protein [Archangium sp.]MDP3573424.1 hypothetical protein [Archangium sp.]
MDADIAEAAKRVGQALEGAGVDYEALWLSSRWLRIELAAVAVSEAEARGLCEGDLLLVEPSVLRTDLEERGSALLVLSTGSRFEVELALEKNEWLAHIKQVLPFESARDFVSVNLVHRLLDSREFPDIRPGATLALNTVPTDQLIIWWREELLGTGAFIEIDEQIGVRVIALAI